MPPVAQSSPSHRSHQPATPHRTFPAVRPSRYEASDSGVIILSSSSRILHMNKQARALMKLFGEAHELWPNLAPESMPSILSEFCRDILSELERRTETRDWAQFEMRRVCHMVTPPLLLKGFGVPTEASREPHMILTLQLCADPSIRPMSE